MSIEITTPFPVFADVSGKPLEDGYIYIGVPNADPVTNPANIYWDASLSTLATQPIRTKGGLPVRSPGVTGRLFINGQYSITVKNKNGFTIFTLPQAVDYITDATVNTIAELRAFPVPTIDGFPISVKGYYATGDGGGGPNRYWASGAAPGTYVDNGGSIIVPTGGDGSRAWVFRDPPEIDARALGFVNDGVTSNTPLISNAETFTGIIFFGPGTWYFGTSRPDLSGLSVRFDPTAILKVDENPNTKEDKFSSNVVIQNPVLLTTTNKPENVSFDPGFLLSLQSGLIDPEIDGQTSNEDLSTYLNKVYVNTTGNYASNGTATLASNLVSWVSSFTGNPQLVYPASVTDGALYEGNIVCGAAANTAGIFSIVADGIWYVTVTTGAAEVTATKRDFSGGIVGTRVMTPDNGGAYGWVASNQQNVAFVRESAGTVVVVIAGVPFYRIGGVSAACGFFFVNAANSNQMSLYNVMKTASYRLCPKKVLSVGVIGDSISYGAWASLAIEDILPRVAQSLPAIGKMDVTNLAISGTSTAYWVANLPDCSGFDYTLVMLGTNDQQGGVSLATYEANLATIATSIVNDDSIPIFGIFPVFTDKPITGTGVDTTNYAIHAGYTSALKRFCVTNGYYFADIRRAFGENIAWYSDNIHPLVEGQVVICAEWARAINGSIMTKTLGSFVD